MSPSLESQRQTTLIQATTIPPSFHLDILALLKQKSVNKTELDTIRGYLKAATLVSGLNSYKAMKEETPLRSLPRYLHQDSDGPESCVIPHVFDGNDFQRRGGDGLEYSSRCCGDGATILEEHSGDLDFKFADVDRLGKCFVGRHTVKAVR
ncbi:hypothetical protein M413DRAFT_438826 [Hebeloma cylindrosporum]|uniref:Uncharacterized protein n=1 Tax=Hebeloma cylindrosporum TaxID=76867 RepID=A0A0C2Z952_HEBCY|nr:hypothetical protein M413DRAFT_438826 [Hebeloma cylindrosporum h7]